MARKKLSLSALPASVRAKIKASRRGSVSGSHLENRFADLWKQLGGPELEREHRFAPPRKWLMDFAHRSSMTAIEIEGGIFCGGRHTRASGFIKDCEKYFEAQMLGWSVVRLTANMITPEIIGRIIARCGGIKV